MIPAPRSLIPAGGLHPDTGFNPGTPEFNPGRGGCTRTRVSIPAPRSLIPYGGVGGGMGGMDGAGMGGGGMGGGGKRVANGRAGDHNG